MRKIITLLASAMMVASGVNAFGVEVAPILKKMDTSALRNAAKGTRPSKMPADLGGNFSSWELLGTGTFNAETGLMTPKETEVYYCTTDPYGYGVDSWCVEGAFGNSIRIAGMPFIDYYNINNFDTGLTYEGKPVMVDELSKYYSIGMETMVYPEMGKFELAMLYYVDDPTNVDNVIAYGIETVQLDGDYHDYNVDMSVAGETREGLALKVDLKFADATNVKTSLIQKAYGYDPAGDEELTNLIASVRADEGIEALGESGSVYFDLDANAAYTCLIITTYDADDESADNYKVAVYDYDGNWDNWGTAEYTDDYLSSYYDEFPINTAKGILVQRHKTEERYRMVNPYTTDDTWTSVWSLLQPADPAVNSYMEVNAVNPEHTYIVIAPMDITDGDGVRLVMGSAAHYNLIHGISEDAITEKGYWGTTNYADNGNTVSVTFPRMTLMMRPINSDYPLFAGFNDSFALVMKSNEGTGVDDLEEAVENSEAIYYDMQGNRIASPESAGVYVRRCGSKIEKVMIR